MMITLTHMDNKLTLNIKGDGELAQNILAQRVYIINNHELQ